MRNRLTGFLRQAANAIQAGKLRDDRGRRERAAHEAATAEGGRARVPASGSGRTLVVGGVTIEYTPSMDGDPDPGEIVWAWVPYDEDPNQGKDRPVVVVGRRGARLVGVPLTSKQDDRDSQVAVGTGSWDRDGRVSYAKLDRLIPLDRARVRREGAILDRDRFDDVIDGLRRVHGN
jgi:hypothetical protein